MKKRLLVLVLALVMALCSLAVPASAEPGNAEESGVKSAKRTILLYCCGSNLESQAGMATFNLEQILASNFSNDDDINFIVMTGGSKMWMLDDDDDFDNENKYLAFPEDVNVPDDAVKVILPGTDVVIPVDKKAGISGVYNQIWEARGKDAVLENGDKDPNAGKLVCVDGDGLTGAPGTAVKNEDELMSDPATLKAFINYGVENYPADKYNVILWDHGGGPQGGYGLDENFDRNKEYPEDVSFIMSFSGIVDALSDNKVVDSDGDGKRDSKFDFVDFDACLMGNLELSYVLADYTKYYIASAETEPGYGQYYGPKEAGKYKGWLDELGRSDMDATYNAEDGSFALGKVIVDDLYEFYSNDDSKGSGDHATLAVFDTEKLVNSKDLLGALNEISDKLKAGAEGTEGGTFSFYDELWSSHKSINYSDSQLFDLADMVSFLGVEDLNRTDSDDTDYTTEYTELAKKFAHIFPRGETTNIVENDFMYSKCTLNEKTEDEYHYDEKSESSQSYGSLFSSGLTIYFPDVMRFGGPVQYYQAMDPVLESMPVKDDGRYEFLKGYQEVVADYGTILLTGSSVGRILNNKYAFAPDDNPHYGDKSGLDYDAMMKYWTNENNNVWDTIITKNLGKRSAGTDGSIPWLKQIVQHAVDDALLPSGMDVTEIKYKKGTGHRIEVKQGSNTIFKSVDQRILAELPVLEDYLAGLSTKARSRAMAYSDFSIGYLEGYNDKGNIWEIPPFEEKWYAIKDGDGKYHVASIYRQKNGLLAIPALYGTKEDGNETDRLVMLEFSEEGDPNDRHELKSVYFFKTDLGPTRVAPAELKGDFTLMPILYVTPSAGSRKYYMPISKTTFVINEDNAAKVSLDLIDIDSIEDIEDTNNDGKSFKTLLTVTDLYDGGVDITDRIVGSLKHISVAKVDPAAYTGKELTPVVTHDGKVLEEGKDYTWDKVPDTSGEGEEEKYTTPDFINARSYDVLLTGKGEYTGTWTTKFVIQKLANPLKLKGKTVKKSARTVKKKSVTLTSSKTLKYSNKGKGKRSFAKLSKSKKYKKIVVNKKTGKITLKKGLKKGTYRLKVKVRAAGTTNYKAATKKVTITIKVK